jgi:hypothetical protein
MARVQVPPTYTLIKMNSYLGFSKLKISKFWILEILEAFEKLNFKYVCKLNFLFIHSMKHGAQLPNTKHTIIFLPFQQQHC